MKVTKTIVLNSGDPEEKREEIRRYFHQTYDLYEKLNKTLKSEKTFYLRADPLRHPLIFYYGHTAAFYINKLIIAKLIDKRIDHKYESMFAIGVDEMSWDDLDETHYDWPTLIQVQEYRDKVRHLVDELISKLPLKIPITWDDPFWAIMMGIEHERIHLETSSALIRQLPIEEVKQLDLWNLCPNSGSAPQNKLLPVAGGNLQVGKSKEHALYGWDNEFGTHETEIKPFKASQYLVSNAEFKEFVDDNGYTNPKWWTEEGWSWRNYTQATFPKFWLKTKDDFKLRTMLHIIYMPWNWPVVVNYLEAKAFCNWKSAQTGKPIRLPTEDEWIHFRNLQNVPDQPYWKKAPGNINLEYYASSCPVDEFKFGDFYDVIGNVWQWTETPISGFTGFQVHPYYDDFSTPTFDKKHNLIKGGSWISTGNEATLAARYAFRRHFFQHAGFRYVETSEPVKIKNDTYEEEPDVTPYCHLHWGKNKLGLPNFEQKLAEIAINNSQNIPKEKALNIGCKVGRTSFELAKEFSEVTGLDFSARQLKAGVNMRDNGAIRYTLTEEDQLVSHHEKLLKDFGLQETAARVNFFQGDISNLLSKYTGYNLIVIENALERAYKPKNLLQIIHQRLLPGGVLVIASTYDWQDEFTEKENRLGGYRLDGEPFSSLDAIKEILSANFKLLQSPVELPFLLHQNARRSTYFTSQVTVWQKKN